MHPTTMTTRDRAGWARKAREAAMGRIADAAARRLGFTPAQRYAYLCAVLAIPAAQMLDGTGDVHDVGMGGARAAGYVGADHPGRAS